MGELVATPRHEEGLRSKKTNVLTANANEVPVKNRRGFSQSYSILVLPSLN
jgi:hypothetical protein